MLNGHKIQLTEDQYQEIMKSTTSKRKSIFDQVDRGSTYFFIGSSGAVIHLPESNMADDIGRLNAANYCRDKSIMEQRCPTIRLWLMRIGNSRKINYNTKGKYGMKHLTDL